MTGADLHIRLPAHRFYWALLETPGGTSLRGPLPEAFHEEFGESLPIAADLAALDALHIVCAPAVSLSGGEEPGLVACAIPRPDLAQLPPAARTLTPGDVPAFLRGRIDPGELNFLVGEHEPAPVKAQRRRQSVLIAATCILASGLVCMGLARRAAAWTSAASDARAAHEQLLASASISVEDARRDPFALSRQIDTLRRATDAAALPRPVPDAALALGSLLRAWPASVEAEPKSLAVRPDGVSLTVEIKGDAKPFLDAFTPPSGWTLDEPRVNNTRGVTLLSLQLRPARGGSVGTNHPQTAPTTPQNSGPQTGNTSDQTKQPRPDRTPGSPRRGVGS